MVSDVPLTKDILGESQPFVFSYYDWLSAKGVRIVEFEFSLGSVTTIFTVPPGKVLFMVNAWASCTLAAAMGGSGMNLKIGTEVLLGLQNDHIIDGPTSISNSYPIPIKVDSGETINQATGAGLTAIMGFSGFLIAKSDLVFI